MTTKKFIIFIFNNSEYFIHKLFLISKVISAFKLEKFRFLQTRKFIDFFKIS